MKKKAEFASFADLIGMDPSKTYMGGGYKREDIRIYNIVIEGKSICAYCDIKNDYSNTKFFHLTQPAAYSCSSQLLVSYYAYTRKIGRQAKGFHILLSNYSTEWKRIIRAPKKIPVEVKEVSAIKNKRMEKVKFKVFIGTNDSVVAFYNVIFRVPTTGGKRTPYKSK